MPPEDWVRIRHMIDAAETVADFTASRQRADLETDRMLLFALVRAIEIIGEARPRYLRKPVPLFLVYLGA